MSLRESGALAPRPIAQHPERKQPPQTGTVRRRFLTEPKRTTARSSVARYHFPRHLNACGSDKPYIAQSEPHDKSVSTNCGTVATIPQPERNTPYRWFK